MALLIADLQAPIYFTVSAIGTPNSWLKRYEATTLTLGPRSQAVISCPLEWLGANMGYFADCKNFHFVVKSSFEPIFFHFEVVTSLKVQPESLRQTEIP